MLHFEDDVIIRTQIHTRRTVSKENSQGKPACLSDWTIHLDGAEHSAVPNGGPAEGFALGTLIDIKGAFNNISRTAIKAALRRYEVLVRLINGQVTCSLGRRSQLLREKPSSKRKLYRDSHRVGSYSYIGIGIY